MKANQFLSGLLVLGLFFGFQNHSQANLTDDEIESVFSHIVLTCANGTEAGILEAANFILGDTTILDNFTHHMKCFLVCFYRKVDFIDYMDHPKYEEFADFLELRYAANKHKVRPALKQCLNIENKDACEEIYQVEACMIKHIQG
ncbi:uncharacterized protein [Musca autumnalis]|uniref:uncharacterized protein n=1 Tax=Musca autumnalis TaxID=221902 RepID=UPI003CEEEAE6